MKERGIDVKVVEPHQAHGHEGLYIIYFVFMFSLFFNTLCLVFLVCSFFLKMWTNLFFFLNEGKRY